MENSGTRYLLFIFSCIKNINGIATSNGNSELKLKEWKIKPKVQA